MLKVEGRAPSLLLSNHLLIRVLHCSRVTHLKFSTTNHSFVCPYFRFARPSLDPCFARPARIRRPSVLLNHVDIGRDNARLYLGGLETHTGVLEVDDGRKEKTYVMGPRMRASRSDLYHNRRRLSQFGRYIGIPRVTRVCWQVVFVSGDFILNAEVESLAGPC